MKPDLRRAAATPLLVRDTTTVRLRELGADDGPVLDAVFAGLSSISRYHRFHAGVPAMHPAVRARLADVDGCRHIAVGAFDGDEPIGIARLIVVGPGRAELAFEVIDAWHGHGIGTWMVGAAVELGVAAGITEVYADVLSSNAAAQRLLAAVFTDLSAVPDGPEITFFARMPCRVAVAV